MNCKAPVVATILAVALGASAVLTGCSANGGLRLGEKTYTPEQVSQAMTEHQAEIRLTARSVTSLTLQAIEDEPKRQQVAAVLHQVATTIDGEVADQNLDADSIVAFTDEVVGRLELDRKRLIMNVYRTAVDLADIYFRERFAQLEGDLRNQAASALLRGVARGVLEASDPHLPSE